jgi:hypothetical protein
MKEVVIRGKVKKAGVKMKGEGGGMVRGITSLTLCFAGHCRHSGTR